MTTKSRLPDKDTATRDDEGRETLAARALLGRELVRASRAGNGARQDEKVREIAQRVAAAVYRSEPLISGIEPRILLNLQQQINQTREQVGKVRDLAMHTSTIDPLMASMALSIQSLLHIQSVLTQGLTEAFDRPSPESRKVDDPTHSPGIDAAIQAGAQLRREVCARTDMLSSDEFGSRMGVSRETVNKRRAAKHLLALQDGKNYLYPAWQLDEKVASAMPAILEILGPYYGAFDIYLFMTRGKAMLDGKTPIECLIEGQGDRVVELAASQVEELAPIS